MDTEINAQREPGHDYIMLSIITGGRGGYAMYYLTRDQASKPSANITKSIREIDAEHVRAA